VFFGQFPNGADKRWLLVLGVFPEHVLIVLRCREFDKGLSPFFQWTHYTNSILIGRLLSINKSVNFIGILSGLPIGSKGVVLEGLRFETKLAPREDAA